MDFPSNLAAHTNQHGDFFFPIHIIFHWTALASTISSHYHVILYYHLSVDILGVKHFANHIIPIWDATRGHEMPYISLPIQEPRKGRGCKWEWGVLEYLDQRQILPTYVTSIIDLSDADRLFPVVFTMHDIAMYSKAMLKTRN